MFPQQCFLVCPGLNILSTSNYRSFRCQLIFKPVRGRLDITDALIFPIDVIFLEGLCFDNDSSSEMIASLSSLTFCSWIIKKTRSSYDLLFALTKIWTYRSTKTLLKGKFVFSTRNPKLVDFILRFSRQIRFHLLHLYSKFFTVLDENPLKNLPCLTVVSPNLFLNYFFSVHQTRHQRSSFDSCVGYSYTQWHLYHTCTHHYNTIPRLYKDSLLFCGLFLFDNCSCTNKTGK
jgi:hypothetical protein